jgi:hypothetical protein
VLSSREWRRDAIIARGPGVAEGDRMKDILSRSIVVVILLLVSRARAEGEVVAEPRSEGTAVLLSLGGLLGPMAAAWVLPGVGGSSRAGTMAWVGLVGAGATWGTSLGYWYAGSDRYALVSGLGKTALLGAGVGLAVLATRGDKERAAAGEVVDDLTGPALVSLASIAVLVWDVVDVMTVPGAVRRHQARAVSLAPLPVGGGWGVAVASGF